jgi:hypothetical protein
MDCWLYQCAESKDIVQSALYQLVEKQVVRMKDDIVRVSVGRPRRLTLRLSANHWPNGGSPPRPPFC